MHHRLGISYTVTNKVYLSCAFTHQVLNMCKQMHDSAGEQAGRWAGGAKGFIISIATNQLELRC